METKAQSDPTGKREVDGPLLVAMTACVLLYILVALSGLLPPKPVMRLAAAWGGGGGALAFLALIWAGWRVPDWFWYPIYLGYMAFAAAAGAIAIAGVHSAVG